MIRNGFVFRRPRNRPVYYPRQSFFVRHKKKFYVALFIIIMGLLFIWSWLDTKHDLAHALSWADKQAEEAYDRQWLADHGMAERQRGNDGKY